MVVVQFDLISYVGQNFIWYSLIPYHLIVYIAKILCLINDHNIFIFLLERSIWKESKSDFRVSPRDWIEQFYLYHPCLQSKHPKSAKLPCRHNIKHYFWSMFVFLAFFVLSFCLFVLHHSDQMSERVSSLKSHSLCQHSKVAVSHSLTHPLTKVRYRAARAAKNIL